LRDSGTAGSKQAGDENENVGRFHDNKIMLANH
jgi:hypothetical protein